MTLSFVLAHFEMVGESWICPVGLAVGLRDTLAFLQWLWDFSGVHFTWTLFSWMSKRQVMALFDFLDQSYGSLLRGFLASVLSPLSDALF